MALDAAMFEMIEPSRYITFTIPSPFLTHHQNQLLRVAVLDSPVQFIDSPRVALMFVPKNREHDWIFSTESGHLQLLLSSTEISRLILIGDQPIEAPDSPIIYHRPIKHDIDFEKRLEESVKPLVIALSRKFCFKNGIYDVPVLTYEDNVVSSVVLEKCVGDFVGEMLVEDVEIESDSNNQCQKRKFRRRLRFKRMPNLVQTEIQLVPETGFLLDRIKIGANAKFIPDAKALVHVYLVPMVASISLIGSYIGERVQVGFRPKALCVGVGGGALVSFLRTQMDFEVVGVEKDEEVFRVARQYFGLEDGEFVQVCVGDAIEFMEKLARQVYGRNSDDGEGLDTKFDVIMVDLDSCDAGNGISAPPLEFVRKNVLSAARLILSDFGIFVINVIPPNSSFYEMLKHEFQKVFQELYEIDVGNGENFVLIATMLPISVGDYENTFLNKLRLLISGAYMDSIRKI